MVHVECSVGDDIHSIVEQTEGLRIPELAQDIGLIRSVTGLVFADCGEFMAERFLGGARCDAFTGLHKLSRAQITEGSSRSCPG